MQTAWLLMAGYVMNILVLVENQCYIMLHGLDPCQYLKSWWKRVDQIS